MIFQLVDDSDERLRFWTGRACDAIRYRDAFEQDGRTIAVADYKGRRLTASSLVECASRENDREAAASLRAFRRLMNSRQLP